MNKKIASKNEAASTAVVVDTAAYIPDEFVINSNDPVVPISHIASVFRQINALGAGVPFVQSAHGQFVWFAVKYLFNMCVIVL